MIKSVCLSVVAGVAKAYYGVYYLKDSKDALVGVGVYRVDSTLESNLSVRTEIQTTLDLVSSKLDNGYARAEISLCITPKSGDKLCGGSSYDGLTKTITAVDFGVSKDFTKPDCSQQFSFTGLWDEKSTKAVAGTKSGTKCSSDSVKAKLSKSSFSSSVVWQESAWSSSTSVMQTY